MDFMNSMAGQSGGILSSLLGKILGGGGGGTTQTSGRLQAAPQPQPGPIYQAPQPPTLDASAFKDPSKPLYPSHVSPTGEDYHQPIMDWTGV